MKKKNIVLIAAIIMSSVISIVISTVNAVQLNRIQKALLNEDYVVSEVSEQEAIEYFIEQDTTNYEKYDDERQKLKEEMDKLVVEIMDVHEKRIILEQDAEFMGSMYEEDENSLLSAEEKVYLFFKEMHLHDSLRAKEIGYILISPPKEEYETPDGYTVSEFLSLLR